MRKQKKSKKIQTSFTVLIRGKEWTIQIAGQEAMRQLAEKLPVVGSPISDREWQACYGCCFRSLRLICIDPSVLNTHLLESTISHEIAHALLDPIAQIGDFHEEVICDVLGESMWEVFRQITEQIPIEWL